MTRRRDFILAGSAAMFGSRALAQEPPENRADEDRKPAAQENGISITDHGARPDRADNSEPISRAIQAALATARVVVIPSGTFRFSTVNFNSNEGSDPRRLVLTGHGTLHSEYRGTALTAKAGPFYDLVIDGPAFESVAGKGTTLLDGDRFRRLVIAPGTQIRNFDWVIRGVEYLQSIRMIGAIIRGGSGAVVKAPIAFDCVFSHNIIEFVTDGFVIDGGNDPALSRCTIDDNVIEGIGGQAMMLGACLATSICNNYLENNTGGDIRMDAGTAPHKGLRLQGNAIQLSRQALAEGRFAVTWGRSTALPVRAGGNYSNGNLHDTVGASALIDMSGDFAAGELYRGYNPRSKQSAPIGRALFSDGLAQHYAWFDREITIDPHRSEIGFSRPFAEEGARILTFGPTSPQQDPKAFDRKQWSRGSVVFNAMPQAQGIAAWICVHPGAPGSWAPIRIDAG